MFLSLFSTYAGANDLSIRIIKGYEGAARYATHAANVTNEKRAALYQQYFVDPYRNDCSGDGPSYTESRWLFDTPVEVGKLHLAAVKISESNIDTIVRRSLVSASQLWPSKDITVCLFPFPPESDAADSIRRRMNGVIGFSEAPGALWLQIIPISGWLDKVPYTIVHEYHHAISYEYGVIPAKGKTLLDTILAEARADWFATTLYPASRAPWTIPLPPNDEDTVWSAMLPVLDSREGTDVERFFFDVEDDVPQWAGYRIDSANTISRSCLRQARTKGFNPRFEMRCVPLLVRQIEEKGTGPRRPLARRVAFHSATRSAQTYLLNFIRRTSLNICAIGRSL